MEPDQRILRARLFWMVSFVAAACFAASGQSSFHNVSFSGTNGSSPLSALVLASDGNFYGTALVGGTNGYGSVFKVSPQGKLTTIYNFCSQVNCADGSIPWGGLMQATDGNFYGTTVNGGNNPNCEYSGGCGTIFKVTAQGVLTTLLSFDGEAAGFPYSGLVQGIDGNFYGTSTYTDTNNGTVFQLTPSGILTVLYTFFCTGSCLDGSDPNYTLVQDKRGTLYGTTAGGGYNNSGTVFRITPTGKLTTLYRFCNNQSCSDGAKPNGVIVGSDGNLYGTTYSGGTLFQGTVFEITSSGAFKTIYKFASAIGSNPYSGLVQGTNGNLYGTTFVGGTGRYGTIFSSTTTGQLTVLHNFSGSDGSEPEASLIEDTRGNLYGTTSVGGTDNDGVVFELTGATE